VDCVFLRTEYINDYFNTLGSKIVIAIPKTAMAEHQVTAFQITAECKISVFATMMQTKKEDRATSIIMVM